MPRRSHRDHTRPFNLGCPSSPSALRIPAATQRHTYVSAPGPRPAHGLETQERAGGHAVRRIQRPQTACRSPPEPGKSARTRRRQEPPFCRRFSSACTQPRSDVQQSPTAAEPPYNGARRHDQISAPNLPPQLTLGVSLKPPPARGPWRTPRPAQRHHPRPRRRSSPRRRAAERPRDHGHGTRPSPTQTAPGGGRSRDHLVGGGRSASHVPYPDLAGRASWPGGHRGDGGERGGAQQPFLSIELSNGFSRAQSLPPRPGCIERRPRCTRAPARLGTSCRCGA